MMEADEVGGTVELGFLEKTESWRLKSHFFPSKVGGKPAWLNFHDLPTAETVQCGVCGGPCIFLCQVYAPIEDQADCFHRTLFVFLCPNAECCQPNENKNLRVLRCQLQRRNDCFSYSPPVESSSWTPDTFVEAVSKVCRVCNLRGTSHCGQCRKVNYCSRQHQVADWKAGHKIECSTEGITDRCLPLLLPEWDIEMETEPLMLDEKVEKSDEEKLKEYETLVQSGQAGTMHDDVEAEADLNAMAEEKEDPVFRRFKKRISEMPNQVLRYEKDGTPLWISQNLQPTIIPPCENCGSERSFEFQLLPQMLNSLELDQVGKSIDWGVMSIFTCKDSCSKGDVYKLEYIHKQDVV